MRDLWKSLLASLPRSWRLSPDPKHREAFLKILIILAIGLAAGPELVTAIEMRILLEILGVALFVTVFVAGARFTLLSVRENLRETLLAMAPVAFIVFAYLEWWLGSLVACMASVHVLWKLVV